MKIDLNLADNPAWRSRLMIGISPPYVDENYEMIIEGSFKNGKLHGLVKMYGKLTADPNGHCSSKVCHKK